MQKLLSYSFPTPLSLSRLAKEPENIANKSPSGSSHEGREREMKNFGNQSAKKRTSRKRLSKLWRKLLSLRTLLLWSGYISPEKKKFHSLECSHRLRRRRRCANVCAIAFFAQECARLTTRQLASHSSSLSRAACSGERAYIYKTKSWKIEKEHKYSRVCVCVWGAGVRK